MRFRLAVLLLLFAPSVFAHDHPWGYGQCASSASCSYLTNTVYGQPTGTQVLVATAASNSDAGSAAISQAGCTLSTGWTAFSAGLGTGASEGREEAWWAKTSSCSGTVTITVTWTGTSARYMNITSWDCATDVDCTQSNMEDTSAYVLNPGPNGCSTSPYVSYTTNTDNAPIMVQHVWDQAFWGVGNSSTSGVTLRALSSNDDFHANINNPGLAGNTSINGVAAGAHFTGFTWGACNNAYPYTALYMVALKDTPHATYAPTQLWIINGAAYHLPGPHSPLLFARAAIKDLYTVAQENSK